MSEQTIKCPNGGNRETVSKYLKVLCEISILEEQKFGREKLSVNPRLLRLLTGDSNKYPAFKVV
jgi:hypothetical protein